MSQKTALQLAQAAAYETGIPAPSGLVAATDQHSIQLRELFHATGRELRTVGYWAQLKRSYTLPLVSGQGTYQLPQDFYSTLPGTLWDQQNRWEMRGPLTDAIYRYRTYGYVTIENRRAFRIFGPDMNPFSVGGQFFVNPTPGDSSVGNVISFEYLSKSWLQPPNWAPSTAYTSGNYVNVNGNAYKCTTSGTSGTVPPSVANAVGQDGGVAWFAATSPAWTSTTYYGVGDYVRNGANWYRATTAGQSGSSAPTAMTTGIADGTVTWDYLQTVAWAGEKSIAAGDYRFVTGQTQLYRALSSGTTGKTAPSWTPTTQTDGTAVWTYQPQAYDALVTDNDLCVYDDEVMIAGLKFRFLRARGLDFQDAQIEYELMKRSARGRWNAGMKIALGGQGFNRSVNIPEGSWDA